LGAMAMTCTTARRTTETARSRRPWSKSGAR
jgi:hypothetical protein